MKKTALSPIRVGDTVGVFSPSEPIQGSRRDRFQLGVKILEDFGLRVRVDDEVYAHYHYMAGTRAVRVEAFNRLLRDSSVRMLMSSWGGKSANQLLDGIDYVAMQRDPKLICGFSDPANILNAVFAKAGVPSLYGPDVVGKLFEDPPEDLEMFRQILLGTQGVRYLEREPGSAEVIVPGTAEGHLVGGNLSAFVEGVLGTEFQPQLEGAIFFWETASPKPRELHQTLTYLRHCGVFGKISGMVVGFLGGIRDGRDWADRNPIEIVREELEDARFPILSLPVFGHGNCPKAPIPVGVRARIRTEVPCMELLESVVGRE